MDQEGKHIKVSICCVAYNHEPYLRQCLDGFVMQQTSFAYEILIHDDASTDGTTDIIREYTAAYPELIRPVIQTENQYSSRTRALITTFLLPLAKGEYIALCEGDDYWTDPLKLQKQVDVLENDPEVSMCLHPAEICYAGGKKKIYSIYKQSQVVRFSDLIRWKHYYWPTGSFVYRKALIIGYPEFCLNCHVGDAPLIHYMGVQGKIYFLNEVMSVYRRNVSGSHSKRFGRLDDATRQRMMQTEFEMLDGFNALTNYTYNTHFIRRKVKLQSNILSGRRCLHSVVYNGFYRDLRQMPLYRQLILLAKIHLIPIWRGNYFKRQRI